MAPSYPGVEVRGTKSSPAGRSLWATRDYAPGTVILSMASPFLVIPNSEDQRDYCPWCLLHAGKEALASCTGCRVVGYCSKACQKADWATVHSKECKAFRRLGEAKAGKLPTATRALVQALLLPKTKEALLELEGNEDGYARNPAVWGDMELQAMGALAAAGMAPLPIATAEARGLLCRIATNAFDRTDIDLEETGIFLDSTLSMINHSCIPNADVHCFGRKAVLHAQGPIKKGEEILVSYINYSHSREIRRQDLKLYHFECVCSRCKDDLDVYEVCQLYPALEINRYSVGPSVDKLRNPPIDQKLWKLPAARAQRAAICKELEPVTTGDEGKRTALLARYTLCKPMLDAGMLAVQPLPQIIHETSNYYSSCGRLASALAITCLAIMHCDPYESPAPFRPQRVKSYLSVARLLSNTAADIEDFKTDMESLRSRDGKPLVTLKEVKALMEIDQVSLCQALLHLVVRYGPMGHVEEWPFYLEAKETLTEIEGLEGRGDQNSLIRDWVRDPEGKSDRSALFFSYGVVEPVTLLAKVGLAILKAEWY